MEMGSATTNITSFIEGDYRYMLWDVEHERYSLGKYRIMYLYNIPCLSGCLLVRHTIMYYHHKPKTYLIAS